ncbi:MAG TPA: fluoride efflux transporter CrcB [Thermodesulfobacteriaceae bacterium]|nr:fluoride efflux transporter CrcB [Thermodesulfobacteriaceae bacterium]
MLRYIIIGAGGFLGAVARYAVSGLLTARLGSRFPYGTMFVNITGSFFLAFFVTLFLERLLIGPNWRLFWAIGFLGAYTTFSTFAWETDALLRDGAWSTALVNVLGNMLAAIIAVRLGTALVNSSWMVR